MFKRVGRWLRRIDGWFFRLTDKQRVGVVLGTAPPLLIGVVLSGNR